VSGSLAIAWRPRARPLEPAAVVAEGAAAEALARACLARGAGGALRGACAPGLLALAGPAGELPWADGAAYFGVDPAAPALLLPTHSAPNVPAALLERAVLRRGADPPVLVVPRPPRLVSLAPARPLAAERLRAWLAGQLA
jgi:hypothetical protein